MTRIFARKAAAVAGVASLALALAACSPPNEQPSDQKVETATEFSAPRATETETEVEETSGATTTTTPANGAGGTDGSLIDEDRPDSGEVVTQS